MKFRMNRLSQIFGILGLLGHVDKMTQRSHNRTTYHIAFCSIAADLQRGLTDGAL